jgi:hypothetical protein
MTRLEAEEIVERYGPDRVSGELKAMLRRAIGCKPSYEFGHAYEATYAQLAHLSVGASKFSG